MKYKGFIIIAVLLAATYAFAGGIQTAPNTTGIAGLPKCSGSPTITAANFEATNATGDFIVYEGDATEVTSAAGKAATATTFIVNTCVGMDDDDIVVIEQLPSGTPIEAGVMSSCVETTKVLTLSAGTTNAFNGTYGFTFYEMKVLTTVADTGTAAVYLSGDLFGGTRDKPMAAGLTAGTVHYLSGECR
jgi:hypothetical protein